MTLDDFRSLFSYSDACRGLLHQTLAVLPPDAVWEPFTSTSRFNSIARLVAHSIGAEERWIRYRIGGQTLATPYEERAAASLDGLFADADTIRQQTYTFLQTCHDRDLARIWRIQMGHQGLSAPVTLTLADMLYQIVNHENYHRGQVVMRLQMLGFDPPNFDYSLLRDPGFALTAGSDADEERAV